MSGLPKRLHEEGNRPTFSSKRSLEDIIASPNLNPNLAGRPSQSIGNEYFPSFEHGKDGRAAKIPRLEPRDSDKRSSVIILPYHNMVSSSIDPHMEHPCNFDNRMEARDAKDSRDPKLDNRENRGDTSREPYIEARVESHSVKVEKDLKLESRVDDKDLKLERDVDFKREIKVEKDGGNTHVNWKDSKDQTWKRIPDSDGWRQLTRTSVHNTEETEKEASTVDDGNCTDAQEAVGENKLDWKCEEKFNEKERKRKDEKIHDWGEKDRERDDRRSNIPFGANNVERRETMREERDSDRWERERKDGAKERERPKDKESIKRESIDANDTENSHYEKEIVDGSMKVPDQDNATIEQKRGKESDSRKGDRDLKDKKKDKDLDAEGDRHDKRGRCIDKDSDDGCVDENGTIEREREGFSYGVQQRRRMLRVRGTPQREPRSRFRPRDIEGSQGKSEVPTVVYKVGECMQELTKLWKEFEESQATKSGDSSNSEGPTLDVRIPSEYVTTTNHQVRGSQIWGTDVYTDDSDLVSVLMHTGYYRPTTSPPPPTIHELRVTIRVLPPQDCYVSTLRHSVRSRAWGAASGCSYRVERCRIIKKGGGSVDLEPCVTRISAVEPTLAPTSIERTMTTRSAASSALRQQRIVREVTIQYNLCNEPWLKYSISIVADKGLKKTMYTSARLKKGEVLYVETHSHRYELCYNGERTVLNGSGGMGSTERGASMESEKLHNQNHTQNGDRSHSRTIHENEREITDAFRWSRCKKPLPMKAMRNIGIPLPIEHVEVLQENLDWEDFEWSKTGVWVAGKEYALARVHFLSPN